MTTRPIHLFPEAGNLGPMTDLYQLTMAAGYHVHGVKDPCHFELFVRRLPRDRGYLVAAGLEQAVAYLTGLSFDEASIAGIRAHPAFVHVEPTFFDRLRSLSFHGDVWAVPEGTPVFPGEPLLAIRADPIEAQLVETYLLSVIGFQTLIATKASRVVEAAGSAKVFDFGFRRAHGPGAAMLATRAALVAGASGTSNVAAGIELGARIVGTAAHSWTMMFESEEAAFRAYHEVFPSSTLLLVDTYDTLEGVETAIKVAGADLAGIRLDSGDLAKLAREARAVLDRAGLARTKIVASGDLNEYKVAELVRAGAPIDSFGVGTEMVTSRDDPTLAIVYKLAAIEREGKLLPRVKTSPGKATYPHPKQIYRLSDSSGRMTGDVVAARSEAAPPGASGILTQILSGGELVASLPALPAIQAHASRERARLAEGVRRLEKPETYPVRFSEFLESERAREAARHHESRT